MEVHLNGHSLMDPIFQLELCKVETPRIMSLFLLAVFLIMEQCAVGRCDQVTGFYMFHMVGLNISMRSLNILSAKKLYKQQCKSDIFINMSFADRFPIDWSTFIVALFCFVIQNCNIYSGKQNLYVSMCEFKMFLFNVYYIKKKLSKTIVDFMLHFE